MQDAQRHKSVGQMMMVHTLTPGGLHAFEELLPGFTEDAQMHGAEQLDKNAILDDKIAIVRPCPLSMFMHKARRFCMQTVSVTSA